MGEEKIFNVEKMVDQYVSKFPVNVVVDKVFLFGSYATGQARDDSDVDLIVLSDDFREMPFIKRLEFLSKLRRHAPLSLEVPMDIFGYTPEEFEEIDKESAIMRRAKKEGRFVWQRS